MVRIIFPLKGYEGYHVTASLGTPYGLCKEYRRVYGQLWRGKDPLHRYNTLLGPTMTFRVSIPGSHGKKATFHYPRDEGVFDYA